MDITYRKIRQNEFYFLKEMLYEALYVPKGKPKFPVAILEEPNIAKYVSNWESNNYDLAMVALDGERLIGAIWGRQFREESKGYGFVNARTPEISMAVLEAYRNKGIGTNLINAIEVAYAQEGIKALSLSVDKSNPAQHLYTRNGYVIYEEVGTAFTMIKWLDNTKSIFDTFAEDYQNKYMDVSAYKDTLDFFCDVAEKEEAEMLEIACGPGNITNYLLEKRPDFKILGIDIAPKMIDLAMKNNPSATFQIMDARTIHQLRQSFDGVLCGFGLPYLSKEEVIELVRQVSRIIVPKGVFYISTMEDEYDKSGYLTPSSGGDKQLFTYYHQADYLVESLLESGFKILKQCRKTVGAATDLIIIAQK